MSGKNSNVEDIYKLTPLQQGILFHTLAEADSQSYLYIQQVSCELEGVLDTESLRDAWQQVTDRHPALRTAFVWRGVKEPVQVVHRELELRLELHDWRHLDATIREHRRAALFLARRRGLELTRAPLMRLDLVRIGEHRHDFLWSFHHLLLDGWSMALVLREVFQHYDQLSRGLEPALERPRPYRDYLDWLKGRDHEASERFWRRELAGFSTPTEVGPVGSRPGPLEGREPGRRELRLTAPETAALQDFAQRRRLTPNTLLQGALALLLGRYTGRREVLFGTTVSGRPPELKGAERTVGLFINTLPVRIEGPQEHVLTSWLEGLQERQAERLEHQWTPLSRLIEWSELEHDRQLFDCLLVVENYPIDAPAGTGHERLVAKNFRFKEANNHPLTIVAFPGEQQWIVRFDPRREVLDDTTTERLLRHFRAALLGLVTAADHREWTLLSAAEHHQLVVEWAASRPAAGGTRGATLPARFTARAARAPDSVAVVCGAEQLSYGELARRAAALARHLRSLGVNPEERVGIYLERSPELVVAILGVLEAGGAYLPLDPVHPPQRLAFLLEDARARLLLTQRTLMGSQPPFAGRTVWVDGDHGPTPAVPAAPIPGPREDQLAYVIYTSGSTGRPKGTLVTHRNVVRLFDATAHRFDFGEEDVFTLFHSCAFDFSVWEMFGALLHGGRLVVVPYWESRSPDAFAALLERAGVTVLNQTPSAFRQLTRAATGPTPRLAWVIFGGEALEPAHLEPWLAGHHRRRARWVNMYGITETTVHVTFRRLARRDLEATGSSPIGRAIDDLTILLLDAADRPVPLGVPGQLTVGGAGLARGYLGRPGLTAQRFGPNPFAAMPGTRLYRSGDLARYLADGELEFLGRIDHQVKIRGFRIEAGEVERALLDLDGVSDCAVLARVPHTAGSEPAGSEPVDTELVAWVVGPQAASAAELRRELAERLPSYMIPHHFVPLTELPLTANGKLDRRALPAPASVHEAARVAPRDELEVRLAGVWGEVLGHPVTGVTETFFELGGDSIKAVRLAARVNEALGIALSVRDIFEHSTIEAQARHLGQATRRPSLDQLRAAGLEEIGRLEKRLFGAVTPPEVLGEDVADVYPLSQIEKGMIYSSTLRPEVPIYHDQFVYPLRLDEPRRLWRAFELQVARHPILRSAIHLDRFPEPVKVVRRSLPAGSWSVEDLTAVPFERQRERITAYQRWDLEHPFRFAGELLWRLRIFRLAEELACVVWTFHHAILDGWSNVILWTEISELCRRADLEGIDRLPAPAHDYKDYLAITLGRRRDATTEAFWNELLAGSRRNPLPFHRGGPIAGARPGMAVRREVLDDALLRALRERARARHVSLQALVLTAHIYLLHVVTGERDLLTGLVSNDRPGLADGEKILGCFLTTLPLRISFEEAPTGEELLARVDRQLRAVKSHELPLAEIAAIAGIRTRGENPIFDTLFNFTDFHRLEEYDRRDLFARDTGTDRAHLVFEGNEMTNTLLDVEVDTTLGRLTLKIKYDRQVFHPDDAEQLIELGRRILEQFAGDLEAPLDPERLLGGATRHRLIVGFNDTRVDPPPAEPVCRLFEQRAAERPDALAVTEGTRSCARSLTYGELERRSGRLARRLRATGVRRGEPVGLLFERSVDLAVALLAILRAGAAYVPLEPSYPAVRKTRIVSSSQIETILADRIHPLDTLPDDHTARFLIARAEEAERLGDAGPEAGFDPDDLAYTIYTSGSTGWPKGVMVEHHAVVNLIRWVNRTFEVGPETTILMLSSIGFDLSVYDLLGGLGAGARVIIAGDDEIRDPAEIHRLMTRHRVSFWSSVPSTMGALVRYLETVAPGSRHDDLRVVLLSGDWIPVRLPADVERFFPKARVISLGGATEATVWSNWFAIDAVEASWPSIPYGRPIDNSSFYILDRALRIVPPGVVGQLLIGGAGVARGYAGDPAKTAAAFLPDRFGDEQGARIYLTGDLGRMLPDANMEFLGRLDHQIKIRGFRIELGEIENQLLHHPQIRAAVVTVHPDGAGEKLLCAHLVTAAPVGSAELRQFLGRTLPAYMIPTTFTVLDELPLTANGKVDRRALPDPRSGHLDGPIERVAPRDETERQLLDIWREVLGVEQIGVHHDFFELGGHSLSAVQVVTRIRHQLGRDFTLQGLFENPTAAQVAAILRQPVAGERAVASEPRLEAGPRPERPALSFAQQRLWFLQQLDPQSHVFNIHSVFRLAGRLDIAALAASLDELRRRQESLRTVVGVHDGQPFQIVTELAPQPLPRIDLSRLPELARDREAERLAREDRRRPFDLARGPLLRVRLLCLDHAEHGVLLAMHHIVSDGWSMAILVRELMAAYSAFSGRRPAPLPELPVQYVDFALWQRRWLTDALIEREVGYWRERLAGAPRKIELPTDRLRPPVKTYRGGTRTFVLDADLTGAILDLGQRHEATLFMTLLAALATLLHRFSGQHDVLVGAPSAHRNRLYTENLIGFFVNTLVLRTDLSGHPSFADLLGRTRRTVLADLDHQDLPFEILVDRLRLDRDPSSTPLFQVMLALQNAPVESFELEGLALRPVGIGRETSQFDLTLMVAVEGERLGGSWIYNTDLFDATTVERLSRGFQGLLLEVSADSGRTVESLPGLDRAARHQLVVEWNDPTAAFGHGDLVHEQIERRSERSPEAIALVFEARRLSYRELERRANRLAHRLRRAGVGPEVRVGIALERSPELVVALLGVLKAGGAYVPLDLEHPRERLAFLCRDAGVEILVSEERLLNVLPSLERRPVFVSSGGAAADRESEIAPGSPVGPANLVYVLHTSGSTGRPKGVMITHRSVTHRLLYSVARDIRPDDRYLQRASLNFDVSVLEIFMPLFAGAAAVLARPGAEGDATYLVDLIESRRVTYTSITPTLIQALLARGSLLRCRGLRQVASGGEAIPPSLPRRFAAALPTTSLYNRYGPTETTIAILSKLCGPDAGLRGTVATGRPIADARVWLLDHQLIPVPIGVAAELVVGGVCLARGYLERPRETARSFVPNSLAGEPGERLYRTGDQARYAPSGELEYLGRLDQQVKIRGFRIELGEVESCLMTHPGVQDAAALARETASGASQLTAWVVPRDGVLPGVQALAAFLAERLPAYMVPSALVLCETIPRTASGKVDRKALEAHATPSPTAPHAAPRNELEERLTRTWQEVLNLARIGIDDNFFELGGNSLLAIEVMARVRNELDPSLPMIRIFERPTIRGFSQTLASSSMPGAQDAGRGQLRRARLKKRRARRRAL